jgi:hypothetical protein
VPPAHSNPEAGDSALPIASKRAAGWRLAHAAGVATGDLLAVKRVTVESLRVFLSVGAIAGWLAAVVVKGR